MQNILTQEQTELLNQTLNLAQTYRRLEAEICEALREIDRTRLYKKIGHRSLFQYVTDRLRFSSSVAYAFVSVTRKSSHIPELRVAIKKKDLTVAKASRIVSCLTNENAASLIQFARTNSCRETEREIARLNPKAARPDRVRAVAEDLNEIQGTISDQVNEKLKRVESLLAQKGKATDLNSVLDAALDEYLKHHDPVKKASRAIVRREKSKSKAREKCETKDLINSRTKLAGESDPKFNVSANGNGNGNGNTNFNSKPKGKTELLRTRKTPPKRDPEDSSVNKLAYAQLSPSRAVSPRSAEATPMRMPLTAEQKHFVVHRDQGRCTHVDETGNRCGSDRWVDLHHIKEVSRGGTNDLSNLTVLCSFHHDLVHQLSLPIDGQFNWLRAPRASYL